MARRLVDKKLILDNVTIDTVGWCWNWTGRLKKGYARINELGRNISVHRRSYELFMGPIPPGLTIDHLCRNTACCNPLHLEPVTNSENRRRGSFANAKTCVHGHPYSPENTIIQISKKGHKSKICRICRAERFRRYRRDDPSRIRATQSKSRDKNIERAREGTRRWRNSDAGVAWTKAYQATPEYKAKARVLQAARRAKRKLDK